MSKQKTILRCSVEDMLFCCAVQEIGDLHVRSSQHFAGLIIDGIVSSPANDDSDVGPLSFDQATIAVTNSRDQKQVEKKLTECGFVQIAVFSNGRRERLVFWMKPATGDRRFSRFKSKHQLGPRKA